MKNKIMHAKYILAICGMSAAIAASAQTHSFTWEEWQDPGVYSIGTAPLRTEFISFATREQAEKGKSEVSPFYMPLDIRFGMTNSASVNIDIPYMWLDREVFLHVEGIEAYYVKINDRTIGYASDDITPAEFNISRWIVDGPNTITFERRQLPDERQIGYDGFEPDMNVYVYSQPKLRIENYTVTTRIDSSGTRCFLRTEVALANSYNSRESFRLGYDLYMPNGGKLIHYDLREVTLEGNGRDTVVFDQPIYDNVMGNLWSAETPKLYNMMLHINYDKRWIEYLPIEVGFGETTFAGGVLSRNGKPVSVKAVSYGKPDKALTPTHLKTFKNAGYNTLYLTAPCPIWFYDMCEAAGMYVIERANVYSSDAAGNREVGGAPSNDPAWLGAYMGRTAAMFERVKTRPCIIGWSLGGNVGNGYNMYKTYQWMKAQGPSVPVIFDDAQGEWNTDGMDIQVADGVTVLEQAAQQAPASRKTTKR